MNHPLNFFARLALALCLSLATTLTTSAAEAPNIILILTDDHGWSQMSAAMDPEHPEAQSDYLETPNMAKLMEQGMRFTSGYSPAPLCTPTRRSIVCGASAARSGTEFKSSWVPAEHLTIPKALKSANAKYRCAHFGKWGEQMISTPEDCGYDRSDGETGNNTGGMPRTLGIDGSHDDGPPHFVDNEDPKLTMSLSKRAVDFMTEESKAGNPFYMQVSYYAQHLSVVAKEETIVKYVEKGKPDRGYTPAWAAMLDELDTGVGQIMDAIDSLGIADNTYIFFTADNGGRGTVPGGDEDRLDTNFPLTGAKHSLNEGGIRVPFIGKGPGIAPGSVTRTPVVGYDFLPTFADLAGSNAQMPESVDGVSFKPLFANPKASLNRPKDAIYFHRPGKLESAIRQGDYKLIARWNLKDQVITRELYNLAENPTEFSKDISESNPEKVAELEEKLVAYLKSVDAESPGALRAEQKRKAEAKRKNAQKKKQQQKN